MSDITFLIHILLLYLPFLLSFIGGILILLPVTKYLRMRITLLISFSIPVLVFFWYDSQDFFMNQQRIDLLIIFLLNFIFLAGYIFLIHLHKKKIRTGELIFLYIMLLNQPYSALSCWLYMDNCFAGACA